MDYSDHTQADLRKSLAAQYRQDTATLIAQGRWPPPWQDADFAIQQDEGRLLSAIADNAGLQWHPRNQAICKTVADLLGMASTGNAKATVHRCVQLKYVRARHDKEAHCLMLDLTDLGAAMLELWEDENSREQE